MCAYADVASQAATRGQRGILARGDYEVVVMCVRSASAHSSTHSVKKFHYSLMIELTKELPSP